MRVTPTRDQVNDSNSVWRNRALRQQTNLARDVFRRPRMQRLPIQANLSVLGRKQPCQAFEPRGLTARIGADDNAATSLRAFYIGPWTRDRLRGVEPGG